MLPNKIHLSTIARFGILGRLKRISLLMIIMVVMGCSKLVEVKPPITQSTVESVYKVDGSAAAVLTGIYTRLSTGSFATGTLSLSLLSGLSADEFSLSGAISNTDPLFYYYRNALFTDPTANPGTENWSSFYRNIYAFNEAVENLNNSTSLTPAVKQQLLGEAKFMRAFHYFYLVNLYGAVPLAITSDHMINSHLSRSSASEVYKQIIKDLLEAKDLLADHYLEADVIANTSERVRPTKWAAAALLARAYLYNGDLTGDVSNYVNAEVQATVVINNSTLFSLEPLLENVFLANSSEAIWQLQPVNFGWNTEDARVFTINAPPSNEKPVSLSTSLYNVFEIGDKRKLTWIRDTTIDSEFLPYPYKYKKAEQDDPISEYLMVLRLGEQYLIRAEARAQQNKIIEAQADLNAIRNRAGLANSTANDKTSLLAAILQERRVELFSEWGNRWFDLKRTGNIDLIMATACSQKGGNWKSYQQLYPILYTDIERDQNLIQNTGY